MYADVKEFLLGVMVFARGAEFLLCSHCTPNALELICVPLTGEAGCCCVVGPPSEVEEELGSTESIPVLRSCTGRGEHSSCS